MLESNLEFREGRELGGSCRWAGSGEGIVPLNYEGGDQEVVLPLRLFASWEGVGRRRVWK